jgi:single-strand DNA-binding protein
LLSNEFADADFLVERQCRLWGRKQGDLSMQRGLEIAGWGNVTREVTLRTSRQGNAFATATIAVTTGKTEGGKDETAWVRATVFGDAAQAAAKSLQKGSRVYFEGSARLRTWQTSDGEKRVDLECACWKLERSAAIGKQRRQYQGKPLGAPLTRPGGDWQAPVEFDDGLPF